VIRWQRRIRFPAWQAAAARRPRPRRRFTARRPIVRNLSTGFGPCSASAKRAVALKKKNGPGGWVRNTNRGWQDRVSRTARRTAAKSRKAIFFLFGLLPHYRAQMARLRPASCGKRFPPSEAQCPAACGTGIWPKLPILQFPPAQRPFSADGPHQASAPGKSRALQATSRFGSFFGRRLAIACRAWGTIASRPP